jgi:hypothetical protein
MCKDGQKQVVCKRAGEYSVAGKKMAFRSFPKVRFPKILLRWTYIPSITPYTERHTFPINSVLLTQKPGLKLVISILLAKRVV